MNGREKFRTNREVGAGGYFTEDEIARSKAAGDVYSDVTAEMLFSSKSNGRLAAEVRRNHPVLYANLKQLWRVECGELPRPDRM